MRKSDKNLAVIQNFILHVTHCSNDVSELDWKRTMDFTPKGLYEHCDDYIAEDHVDGRENPEDEIDEIEQAKKVLEDAGFYVGNLWHVDDVRLKIEDDITDEDCQYLLEETVHNEFIIEQINDAIEELIVSSTDYKLI